LQKETPPRAPDHVQREGVSVVKRRLTLPHEKTLIEATSEPALPERAPGQTEQVLCH